MLQIDSTYSNCRGNGEKEQGSIKIGIKQIDTGTAQLPHSNWLNVPILKD